MRKTTAAKSALPVIEPPDDSPDTLRPEFLRLMESELEYGTNTRGGEPWRPTFLEALLELQRLTGGLCRALTHGDPNRAREMCAGLAVTAMKIEERFVGCCGNGPVPRPVRVRLQRSMGWRIPPDTVKVDRSTKWGNPCLVERGAKGWDVRRGEEWLGSFPTEAAARKCAVEGFREVLEADLELRLEIRRHLRGRNLACWCPEEDPCHADLLLETANSPLEEPAPLPAPAN